MNMSLDEYLTTKLINLFEVQTHSGSHITNLTVITLSNICMNIDRKSNLVIGTHGQDKTELMRKDAKMRKLISFLHSLNMIRLRLLLKFEPKTWRQLSAWVKLYNFTDLSFLENYFALYLKYGLVCKNMLFRNRLMKERLNRNE